MRPKAKFTALAALLGVFVFALTWVVKSTSPVTTPSEIGSAGAAPLEAEPSGAAPSPVNQVPHHPEALTALADRHERVDATPRRTTVPGASLRWTPLPEDLWPPETWSALFVDWAALDARAIERTADASGELDLPEDASVEPQGMSAVWLTHPSHAAEFELVDRDRMPSAWPALLERPAFRARVVDEDGRGVAGALVSQVAAMEALQSEGLSPDEVRALRAFRARATSGADGHAQLTPAAFATVVFAQAGQRRSEFVPVGEGETQIVLRETFALEVDVLQGTAPAIPADATLVIARQRPTELAWVWSQRALGFGSQRILAVPLPRTVSDELPGQLSVTLTGEGLATAIAWAPWPRVGDTVALTLTVDQGVVLNVEVHDHETKAALSDAVVTVGWVPEGSSMFTPFAIGTTGSEGKVHLTGVRAGTFDITVVCPGYQDGGASLALEPGKLSEDIDMQLARAGSIAGRVLQHGEPVPDMIVAWWVSGTNQTAQAREFHDPEGRFLIDNVPLGGITLTAAGRDRPGGETQTIEVTPEGVQDLVIELPEAVRGKGRVIDGETGRPIEGARVVTMACAEGKGTALLDEEVRTDSDGRFELGLLSPVCAAFGVLKEGYGDLWDIRPRAQGNPIEFGNVPLHALRDLTVHLVGVDDPSSFQATLKLQGNVSGGAPFDASGIAVLPGLRRASYIVELSGPGGLLRTKDLPLHALSLPEPWTLEFDCSSARFLEYRITASDGASLEELAAFLAVTSEIGRPEWYEPSIEHHAEHAIVRFEHLPTQGTAGASFFLSGECRFVDELDLADSLESRDLELSSDSIQLRLLDPAGEPLALARADFLLASGEPGWAQTRSTDDEGRLLLAPTNVERVLANVFTDSGRMWFGIPVELPEPGAELEVRLPPLGTLRLRAVDDLEPQSGVKLQLYQDGTYYSLADRYTDAEGSASFDGFSEGEYEVRVTQDGYWPTRTRVRIAPDGGEQVVPALPLGDLELWLRDAQGLALAGLELELVCLQLDERVSDWLAAGRVYGEAQGAAAVPRLVTDAAGRLSLQGLPSGSYAWTAKSPSGHDGAGELRVRARTETRYDLSVNG